MSIKNYGLNLEKELADRDERDWENLGAFSPVCLALIPPADRFGYLPIGEVQRGAEDTMDCATRWVINALEAKLTYLLKNKKLGSNAQWLIDNGYVNDTGCIELADAFNAIKSGTTKQGNSLKAPLESVRKDGVIPKSMIPLESWMKFEDYHNPERIFERAVIVGQEFIKRFKINYERKSGEEFLEWLDKDMLGTGGYAWPKPKDGEYPRTESSANHAFLLVKKPPYYIFDNYVDSIDGDFIKKLAEDYNLIGYGYCVMITAINEMSNTETSWPLLRNFVEFLKAFFNKISIWKTDRVGS